MVMLAGAAPWIAPKDPTEQTLSEALSAPSRTHIFGTDQFGRDILSRVVYGARISLWVGLISVGIACLLGVPFGLMSGYYPGWVDSVVSRVTDVILGLPAVLLALAIMAILGPSIRNVIVAVSISLVPQYVRTARGSALSLKEREYVAAARAIGASGTHVLWRHILPNSLSPLIVITSLEFPGAILFAAGLSFLGLGAQPPSPEWGAMLAAGRLYMREAWWIPVFPGLAITITVLAMNMVGDALRDRLDPRFAGR